MKQLKMIFGILLLFGSVQAYAQSDSNTGSSDNPGQDQGSSHGRPPRHEFTSAQKACFTDNGLTAPGEGAPPKERPDHAVMEKVHECLKKNGMTHFGGPHGDHNGPPPSDDSSST